MTVIPLRRASRIAPGRWRVPSGTDAQRTYNVQLAGDRGTCDCLGSEGAARKGNICKHIRACLEEESKMNENNNAVAIRDNAADIVPMQYNPTFPTKQEIQSIIFMAKNFYQLAGKMIPASIKSEQEAFAVMIAGREWGLGPMESLREMYVVNGTTMPSYRVLAGAVLRGDPTASFKWLERSATKATAQLIRKGRETIEVTYTIEDAKRAGLESKDNWKKYPTDMLCAKVVTRLCRLGGADLITRISASVRGAPGVMRAVEEDADGEPLDALEAAPQKPAYVEKERPLALQIHDVLHAIPGEQASALIARVNESFGETVINEHGDTMIAKLDTERWRGVLTFLQRAVDDGTRESTEEQIAALEHEDGEQGELVE